MKRLLTQLVIVFVASLSLARATTIDFSGSVTGVLSTDPAGRCAPIPTVTTTGTGVATLLNDFSLAQSHCVTSDSSFDDGIFAFTSISAPEDSLFGTYFAVASPDSGATVDFTAILLVTGGTGQFENSFGAIFGLGTLNQDTGAMSETFSGQVDATTPEPGTMGLIAMAFVALWLLNKKPKWSLGSEAANPKGSLDKR